MADRRTDTQMHLEGAGTKKRPEGGGAEGRGRGTFLDPMGHLDTGTHAHYTHITFIFIIIIIIIIIIIVN